MKSLILHPIEKQIIKALKMTVPSKFSVLLQKTTLTEDQLRRGIEWLRLKKLIDVIDQKEVLVSLDSNALRSYNENMPERKIIKLVNKRDYTLQELQQILKYDFNAAISKAKKNNWIDIISTKKNVIVRIGKTKPPNTTAEEKLISDIAYAKIPENAIIDTKSLESLKKRSGFIKSHIIKSKLILLNKRINFDNTNNENTHDRPIDVESDAPLLHIAHVHPLKETINEVRDILISFGFSEIVGNLTQPSFWNFDALFTPQNHPAREMQDTFYLDYVLKNDVATPQQIKNVSYIHNKKWHYKWQLSEAKKMILRTHTTCTTIKYISSNLPKDAKIFSLGRVFRNEKSNYKHLSEFQQIEGLIVGADVNLRNLMGIQKEFCKRIGLNKIKFWPTFFPYTEPSLQTMVYNKRTNNWMELFGMGIIRPEVTKPLGVKNKILAFGGGIERIAMLKYNIEDVREFYINDLNLLRNFKCQL
ncbi:MAG: phenylalanine--tRNA ligase subunit alpha [Thaumarchaeota archaeon]|nr:phenylalanine--tRNA ligase subunit alpha [Nitrososphaerota archaeon]